MNKLTTTLLTLALSAPVAHAGDAHDIIAGAVVIGVISEYFNGHGHGHGHNHNHGHTNAHRHGPSNYAPNPNYRGYTYGQPRIVTTSEPCSYYGQMVMTFDQFGQPIGYRNCL